MERKWKFHGNSHLRFEILMSSCLEMTCGLCEAISQAAPKED